MLIIQKGIKIRLYPSRRKNIKLIKSTVGTTGNHAREDRVRLVNKTAVIDEPGIHVLYGVVVQI